MPLTRLAGALALGLAASAAVPAGAAASGPVYTLAHLPSSLSYTFTQAGAANQGRFGSFTVSFDPTDGRLAVVINMRSSDTGDAQRNGILDGKDLFDVARYPQARFTATAMRKNGARFIATGRLTLRGVTRTIAIPFTWHVADVGGHEVGTLAGQTTIDRLDYGIGQGQWRSTEWVGNAVTIHYSVKLTASG